MPLYYVDSSALVKLVLDEPESDALRTFFGDADLVASELVLAEVPRAIHRACAADHHLPVDPLLSRASEVIEAVALHPLDQHTLRQAAAFTEPLLRTLDAIHIAAAVDVAPIDGFISYDERQSAAARLADQRTFAPGT